MPGSPSAWNAYAFAHVEPVLDRGGIAELVAEKGRVDPATAGEPLDGYMNMYYRSAKNARDGRPLEARLDAAESIPYLLEFLFARPRPRPPVQQVAALGARACIRWKPPWTAERAPPPPRAHPRRRSRRAAAPLPRRRAAARERGHGDVVDGWEPDVPWLRGRSLERGTPRRKVPANRSPNGG